MLTWKNDRGYALLIVLLTIVVIGIFIPLIMTSILSSVSQYNNTEKIAQHHHLADMGALYFERTVSEAVNNWRLPEEWKPPSNWESLSNANKEELIKSLMMESLEDYLTNTFQIGPQFSSDGFQFSITTFPINIANDYIDIRIHTSIDNGQKKVEHDKQILLPAIHFSYKGDS